MSRDGEYWIFHYFEQGLFWGREYDIGNFIAPNDFTLPERIKRISHYRVLEEVFRNKNSELV